MIAFRHFSKRFGRHAAVSDLTFQAGRGEVVALLGPNGSGKTTSLKAAAGLLRPSAGEVLIGDPPRHAGDAVARRACAYLPQRVSFPDQLSGREVVEFYCTIRGAGGARVDEALEHASLNGASARAVGTYSGGMTQRLGLAVALAADAPLMLLDEPTAALDPDGLCAFYALVQHARAQGRTIVFSSHQLGDVERLADRLAILVGGRLVATFTASELSRRLADRGVMKVAVDRAGPQTLAAVQRLAPHAVIAADQIVVPGPARIRPAVLDVLRASGVEILGLTAEEGRLDTLYRELVAMERPVSRPDDQP